MAQIKQIKQSAIKRALRLHKQWLNTKHTDTPKGKRLKVSTKMINMIDFRSANFSGADFRWANFRSANFSGADFSEADFSGANFRSADFSWANFSGADFSGADFSWADFSEADFSGADFSGADFSSANFSGADFSWADFSSANFSWANFSGADFSGADFSSANFSGADFSSANFSWANWNNIKLNYINSICTNGLTIISCQLNTSDSNRSIQYWKGLGIVTAGCFSGTLDELKRRVETVHKENKVVYDKYQAVFKYIDTVLELEADDDTK